MITVTIEKRYGAATVHARVSAPTIERAVEIAGPNARVRFPIEGETFFAPERGYPADRRGRPVVAEGVDYGAMTYEQVEEAYEAGLPGAHEAYLDLLRDDMGAEAFETHAAENCLV